MLNFHDILKVAGIDPADVIVLLHSPSGDFGLALPGLAASNPSVLEVYQSMQSKPAERSLKKGLRYCASFVRTRRKSDGFSDMVFCGIFANLGWRDVPHSEVRALPEMKLLRQDFEVDKEWDDLPSDHLRCFFKLENSEALSDLKGRLLVSTKLTQNIVRLGQNFDAEVVSILEKGVFDQPPPNWRDLSVSGALMRNLPQGWAARLSEWRGIYLITDQSDGARYVGSAYGAENLCGRWLDHVSRDEGVTKELLDRDPINFRFTILERVSPDMPIEEITKLEQTWMFRLDTKQFGLNS